MANPLVSVIIPTHKRPDLLERSIRSVLAQSYTDWELIIVDDNDEDTDYRRDTERFMVRYADHPQIRYVRHQKNSGQPAARNTGTRQAAGKYVAFLDDDDEWLPAKLEEQIACFGRAGERVALVYTYLRVIYTESGTEKIYQPEVKGASVARLLAKNYVNTPSSVMCTKASLYSIGLFDEMLPAHEDWDLYLRLAEEYDFDCVGEPLTLYYKHGGDQMLKNLGKLVKAYEMIYEKHRQTLEGNRKLRGRYLFGQGKILMRAGDFQGAKEKFIASLRANPLNKGALRLLLQVSVRRRGVPRTAARPLRSLLRRLLKHE